jgi:putative ABC transport system permease protein
MGWLFGRRDEDLGDEIRTHLQMAEQERIERGETPANARANARREFGNVALVAETTREMWGWTWLDQAGQDVRYGLRLLRRSPGFASVAIACLGLGIGVTTTIFSALNALLLRPLPYANPDRVAVIHTDNVRRDDAASGFISWGDFVSWRAESRTLTDLGVFSSAIIQIAGPDGPEPIAGAFVSPTVLPLMQLTPRLGRSFVEKDQQFGLHRSVILSHDLWQRRFGGDPAIVGRTIQIGSGPIPPTPYLVVGVMPPGHGFPEGAEIWAPQQIDADEVDRHDARRYQAAIGRLASGQSLADARREITAISRRLQTAFPKANDGWEARVVSLREDAVAGFTTPILLFQGAALVVLLIGCVNMANLLLARGTVREREMAVRLAIGAGRGRVARQLLTESVIIALAGGAAGVALTTIGIPLLVRNLPVGVPEFVRFSVDRPVLIFATMVSILTGVAFGAVPAWRARCVAPAGSLRKGGRESAGGVGGTRMRQLPVTLEVALSLVLAIGATLLIRSNHTIVDRLGYNPKGVLWISIPTPAARYEGAKRETFFSALAERLRALPDVEAVAYAGSNPPLGNAGPARRVPVVVEGRAPETSRDTVVHEVSPDYFQVIGVPLVRGRGFEAGDRPFDQNAATFAAVVNEAFVRARFPGEDPIGQRVRSPIPGGGNLGIRTFTIVGVVRDFRQERPPRAIPPAMYAYLPLGINNTPIVLRTTRANPVDLVPAVRSIVKQMDPTLRVAVAQTFERALARALWRERAYERVLSLFGGLALMLALLGIYGVLAYGVAQRTREFGVRLALGATRREILLHVIRRGLVPVVAGVVLGLAAAAGFTRLIAGVLYDVAPTDAPTFVAVAAAVVVLALGASLVPARRATSVDPVVALRAE